jgi:hypothetical protein
MGLDKVDHRSNRRDLDYLGVSLSVNRRRIARVETGGGGDSWSDRNCTQDGCTSEDCVRGDLPFRTGVRHSLGQPSNRRRDECGTLHESNPGMEQTRQLSAHEEPTEEDVGGPRDDVDQAAECRTPECQEKAHNPQHQDRSPQRTLTPSRNDDCDADGDEQCDDRERPAS